MKLMIKKEKKLSFILKTWSWWRWLIKRKGGKSKKNILTLKIEFQNKQKRRKKTFHFSVHPLTTWVISGSSTAIAKKKFKEKNSENINKKNILRNFIFIFYFFHFKTFYFKFRRSLIYYLSWIKKTFTLTTSVVSLLKSLFTFPRLKTWDESEVALLFIIYSRRIEISNLSSSLLSIFTPSCQCKQRLMIFSHPFTNSLLKRKTFFPSTFHNEF